MAKDEPAPVQLQIVPKPDAERPAPGYSNHLRVNFTPEDFTLEFGWYTIPSVDEPPEDGNLRAEIEPVARIVLPLNLMRNVIALLERQLANYERSFGPIPEHPNRPDWMKESEEVAKND